MLAESQALLHLADALQQELAGTLIIGLNENSEFLRVPDICSMVVEQHSKLQLHLQNSTSSAMLSYFDVGKLDCGFIIGEVLPQGIAGIPLTSIRIVVTAPVSWQNRLQGAGWKGIVILPWVWQYTECSYRRMAEQFFREKNIGIPESIYSADQDATTLAFRHCSKFSGRSGQERRVKVLRHNLAHNHSAIG